MRSGGCAVQQALAAEAGAVVRQAVALARRRGHAQVTPLHVASAMLSPAAGAAVGLLRAACLRAHSHPLQCKALELCFNVALSRLPTAGPAAAAVMFHSGGGYHGAHGPVLSNALVAAFKRAQAHQRRGGAAEGPQSPPSPAGLASSNKVELEQLVVSILDDPSVSRVMREAGFSSTQVKANVEKAIIVSSSSPLPPEHHHSTTTTAGSSPSSGRLNDNARVIDDDAMRVIDCMAGGGGSGGKRRCAVVVVGESAEGVVKAVMDRVSKGELQQHRHHERLKNLQFVPLSAASFRRMTRDEVDARAAELRALVRQGCAAGKGVVLVLEDLAYASEAWAAASERRKRGGEHGYCPVEHGVMEVSSLVAAAGAGRGLDRFWLLGFGNNQAYIKCRAGQPSLEAVWELHPVVVPDGGGAVALSLSCTSSDALQSSQERSRTGWPFVNGAAADGSHPIACAEPVTATSNDLPQWLRGYQDSDQNGPESCTPSLQLQKWNRNCNGSVAHPTSEPTLSFSLVTATTTLPAPSSTSGFANNTNMTLSCKPCQFMPMQPWLNHRQDDPIMAKSYDNLTLHANPSPESYSVSSSPESGAAVQPKFTEVTAENLKILCNTLENRVPHHKDMVADIASAVLQCRSGMARMRMRRNREKPNMATWLLFHGRDNDGKKAVAQELASLVFGSYSNFTSILLSNDYTPMNSKSCSGEIVLKRQRSMDNGHGYVQKLNDTILENPHQVILIDGIDQLECESKISIRSAMTNGKIASCNGDETSLEDVIVILSCEALDDSRSSSCYSPRLKQRAIDIEVEEEGNDTNIEKETEPSCFMLDLNACAEDGEGDEGGACDITNIVDGVFFFQSTEDL